MMYMEETNRGDLLLKSGRGPGNLGTQNQAEEEWMKEIQLPK